MHRVNRSILVTYSAGQMFDLVADVDRYAEFLPWCNDSSVRALADGAVEARITIDFRGVRSRFATRNINTRPSAILMELVDGPFRRLDGQWRFRALRADACRVELQLRYEFVSGLLGRAIAPVFDGISASLIDSFSQRADALYGA